MIAAELMGNYGIPPVTFVRGRGAELYDDQDNRYLDFLCGLAVTSLGHAHPAVTEAINEQAGVLTHVSNLFANEPTAEVAIGASLIEDDRSTRYRGLNVEFARFTGR